MPPSAVTSTSSIIIILTLVHPFATSWPSSPKGDARTLRDWMSVSYVTQYPVPPIFSFPLEGKCLEEAKGCTGQSTDRMLHRGPDRQSAACVIWASYPWTCLRYEGSEGSEGSKGSEGAGRTVLMFKKAIKKELPKEFSFFILIRMRSSVRCPRCRRDLRCCRMLWLRSCSKRPVLRSSGVLRLRGLPRNEHRSFHRSHTAAGR